MAGLRFGVCGTAHWAGTVHLPALQRADGVTLVGVQGRNAERRELLADTLGIRAFADFDAMLAEVDAVSFAMPPALQPELALRAIAAGKHVILEKPAAQSIADAQSLRQAIAEAGVTGTCFLTRRHIPETAGLIERARAAAPRSGYVTFQSVSQQADSPYAGSLWRKAPDATLWDVGAHTLTPLLSVLGPVASISGECIAQGTYRLDLIHENGATSRIDIGHDSPPGRLYERYEFGPEDEGLALTGPLYDRVGAFGRAIIELLETRARGETMTPGLVLALDMVPVLVAAQQAVAASSEQLLTRVKL
ncbi:Oxidoreductase family, NAD-binding Rossmann fold [Devosia enhydra]|uniref:Oxidoreductase family, NAD-binding Rossmann fold n=1 Tax=Devosia enhydra TaxID=665118 RepID=A0A1K2HSC1_9HYPH|nr:Gfo/Idh/MocA family oxidoreductase [Devosia enhydra]SFZ80728.1 Oxidoreductase family, NAD-binding Rossmann fold [Devosia enhydra]